MPSIEEIRSLKEFYIELYSKVRAEQKTDQEYRDDTFAVPEVTEPHKLLRSGIGARIVDAPAEQIITSNPQAFVTTGNKDAAERLSKEANRWFDVLRRQNPNPIKEFVKNLLGRGESYIQVIHNEKWVTGNKIRRGLPVHFLIPDPMVVYGSPEEDENGVPYKIIVFYERQVMDLIPHYPLWGNPLGKGTEKDKDKMVSWLEGWFPDERYFEADSEAVLEDGENIYGFVPFVRKYSGFGRRSPEGKLEDLIISDIRLSRDLIRDECATRSDLASIIHLFAHRPVTIIVPSGTEINAEEISKSLDLGAYSVNVLQLPEHSEFKDWQVMMPEPQMFEHLRNIKAEINQRNPFTMAGYPFGSSGRQQDMASLAAMKRYDTVVENTENAFATAIEMAFKICKAVPTLKPDGVNKGDLEREFSVEVKLKASDPIEEDRKATLGSRLWNGGNGEIDLRTNLIQYQGFDENEAEDIIASILADKVTLYNPDVAEVMGMVFAEESGMGKWIEEAKQRRMMRMEQEKALQKSPTPSGNQRMQGEVQSPMGREMLDMALSQKGSRNPPQRYEQR